MKSLTIHNRKGGVGKTTLAFHACHYFAERGLRVVVIDLDPQEGLTGALLSQTDGTVQRSVLGSADLLMRDVEDSEIDEGKPGIVTLFASDGKVLFHIQKIEEAEVADILRDNLARFRGKADLILMDTGATHTVVSYAALAATDYLLIPMDLSAHGIDGLEKLVESLPEYLDVINPNLQTIGILPTKVNLKEPLQRIFLEDMRASELYGPLVTQELMMERAPYRRSADRPCTPVWKQSVFLNAAAASKEIDAILARFSSLMELPNV